ncbi:FitA-like ribbon-helix-helix domain-containing protein [Microbacterium sp. PMB16]|uniref:FitA-like ribbon-helix-helix domain-containing protein n=1 Tax=Microbacterium sp. PMB16 TaxID=3120157 RepID=UPI003F4C0465
MATVTIRNLSDEVVAALKERARRNSRSMEAEAREALMRLVESGEFTSGVQASLAERIRPRWSLPASVLMDRIAQSPPPAADTAAWLADIRADGDIEDFRDPWEPHAAS